MRVMNIVKLLDLKLYKNDNLKIFKNNIAYLQNFDKIVFVVEEEKFIIEKINDNLQFIKENIDSKFLLVIGKKAESIILLKEPYLEYKVKVEHCNYEYKDKKIIIEYKLESDEEKTLIEITFQ